MKKVHVRKLRDMKVATGRKLPNFRLEADFRRYYAGRSRTIWRQSTRRRNWKSWGAARRAITPGRIRTSKRSRRYWPIGQAPALAMAIMLYLGVRRSDAVLIGRQA